MIKKIILISLLLTGCSVLPKGYETALIGTWNSSELVTTPTGPGLISRVMVFDTASKVEIDTTTPIGLPAVPTMNFFYKVGYVSPRNAIVFFESGVNVAPNPPAVGSPIYFRFEDDLSTLITSLNANMSLATTWTR